MAAGSGWNEPAPIAVFRKGLDQLIQLSIQLDQHHRNKGLGTRGRGLWRFMIPGNTECTLQDPEPIDIENQKVTPQECEWRQIQELCLRGKGTLGGLVPPFGNKGSKGPTITA